MDNYGINNVRGGSFVQVNLDQSTINYLLQMRNGRNNKCFICNEYGHFAKQCEKIIKKEIIKKDELCNCITSYFSRHIKNKCLLLNALKIFGVDETIKDNSNNTNNNACYRCGRNGHYSNNCYASKHINGKKLY